MNKHLSKLYYQHEHLKILLLLLLILLVLIIIVINVVLDRKNLHKNYTLGVSYSPNYAQALELDPKQTYQEILKDLNVKNIRLAANWNEINPGDDEYDFTDLNY